MKKTLLSMLMFASCFSVVNAQLMVDENGRVGMNIDTTTFISKVIINYGNVNITGNRVELQSGTKVSKGTVLRIKTP